MARRGRNQTIASETTPAIAATVRRVWIRLTEVDDAVGLALPHQQSARNIAK